MALLLCLGVSLLHVCAAVLRKCDQRAAACGPIIALREANTMQCYGALQRLCLLLHTGDLMWGMCHMVVAGHR